MPPPARTNSRTSCEPGHGSARWRPATRRHRGTWRAPQTAKPGSGKRRPGPVVPTFHPWLFNRGRGRRDQAGANVLPRAVHSASSLPSGSSGQRARLRVEAGSLLSRLRSLRPRRARRFVRSRSTDRGQREVPTGGRFAPSREVVHNPLDFGLSFGQGCASALRPSDGAKGGPGHDYLRLAHQLDRQGDQVVPGHGRECRCFERVGCQVRRPHGVHLVDHRAIRSCRRL